MSINNEQLSNLIKVGKASLWHQIYSTVIIELAEKPEVILTDRAAHFLRRDAGTWVQTTTDVLTKFEGFGEYKAGKLDLLIAPTDSQPYTKLKLGLRYFENLGRVDEIEHNYGVSSTIGVDDLYDKLVKVQLKWENGIKGRKKRVC